MGTDSPRQRRSGEVRLTPPPRAAARPGEGPVERRGSGDGRLLTWLTAAAFVALVAAAVSVFVALPEWAEARRHVQAAAPPPAGMVEEGPMPAADVSPAVAPPDSAAAAPRMPSPPAALAEGEGRPSPPAPHPEGEGRRSESREAPRAEAFAGAMTEGLAALDRQDFAAARAAFASARGVKPDSPQAADGLARAEAGLRRLTIAAQREEAEALEAEEEWRDALAHYEAVLAIDPAILFAQEGRDRARDRAELAESLAFHLASPGRLSSDEVLREASDLVARAAEIEPAGPRHRRQVAELRRLVDAFARPVVARLRSDDLTQVVVYRVGRLGTFTERSLELRPGTYTVVGSREGYRDVRRQLRIEPGEEPEPLEVRCEEKI